VRRLAYLVAGLALFAAAAGATPAVAAYGAGGNCSTNAWMCTEVYKSIGPNYAYTGHDEPSVLFYSNQKSSGNSTDYTFRLPRDPAVMPTQDGLGTTWNFQQHPAFWFGMAMCDNESAPEYTKTCTPDSDTNIKDGADPSQPDYIGYHAGTAFMEMQFYPPGWVPWEAGVSCTATQWCAALNIDSLSENMNTADPSQVLNNNDCLNTAGVEPVGFAFITKNGHPQATVDPRTAFAPPFDQTTPDLSKDMLMNPGDVIKLSMHDSGEGFRVDIQDVTTHQHGSMVAGAANGWNHVLFQPNSSTCNVAPYSFHPMYSTSSEHTRVPWAAHSYNVAYSDEIGHFEYCNLADENGNCIDSGNASDPARDGDDIACFNPDDSLLVAIGGCIFSDGDFDGTSYKLASWAGNGHDSVAPDPITFSSATFNGGKNYDRIAFEADLPRIEGPPCNRFAQGAPGCSNPPAGAQFYPFFSTNDGSALAGGTPGLGNDPQCVWTEGGPSYPGTTNNFGGSSTTEFGPALGLAYPAAGFHPTFRWNNFRRVLDTNPCPS
jgi:hypothetical protein